MQKILHKNTYYSTNKNNALKLLMFGFILEVSQDNTTLRSLSQRQYIWLKWMEIWRKKLKYYG